MEKSAYKFVGELMELKIVTRLFVGEILAIKIDSKI